MSRYPAVLGLDVVYDALGIREIGIAGDFGDTRIDTALRRVCRDPGDGEGNFGGKQADQRQLKCSFAVHLGSLLVV